MLLITDFNLAWNQILKYLEHLLPLKKIDFFKNIKTTNGCMTVHFRGKAVDFIH